MRLSRTKRDVSVLIAEQGGVVPLVKLASNGSPGAQQQAAAALAELALVDTNRDAIANAQGLRALIRLTVSCTIGTPDHAVAGLHMFMLTTASIQRAQRE